MSNEGALKQLVARFQAAGARDPEAWARSQIHDGFSQLHRFLFLRQAWKLVIGDQTPHWIDSWIAHAAKAPDAPFAGAGHALASLRSRGASDAELTELVRCAQAELLVGFAYLLEDPGLDDDASLNDIAWGLFAVDEQGMPTEPLAGLHESVLENRSFGPRRTASSLMSELASLRTCKLANDGTYDKPPENRLSPAMPSDVVKVALTDDEGRVETLWATPIGGYLYRLENIPFYAFGVSWNDVVEAPLDEDERPAFRRVVEKSGNRTVRIMLEDVRAPEAKPRLEGLLKFGCGYEGHPPRLLAINVPPETSLDDVAGYLAEAGIDWEYADPTYEELFPKAEA